MSGTAIPPAPTTTVAGAITSANSVSSLVSNLQTAAIHGAANVPEAARAIAVLDPELAAQIAGKSALGSKTIIAPIVAHALTWAVGHYGLGWDAATTESVAGLISIGLMAAFRVLCANPPIKSLLPQKPIPTP